MDRVQATGKIRKRKAETQDNERLSKRLSLLNLERTGHKLYVPVEHPTPSSSPPASKPHRHSQDGDVMQIDDTKHKVYIYDLDAELSDSESSDDGRLVFLPDIRKHLRETRIPPSVLANRDGELAGNNLQMVLYNVPSSLSVPEGQDSVRKAILESRARARAKQGQKLDEVRDTQISKTTRDGTTVQYTNGLLNDNSIPPDSLNRELVEEDDVDGMDLD